MPHHAAKVKDFAPDRLVGWLQDELQRFHNDRQAAEDKQAADAGRKPVTFEAFTLHDFRRTAITGLQMAGVSEKEASVMVGATPEVIRRHYERLDQQAIARRSIERRIAVEGLETVPVAQTRRAGDARGSSGGIDSAANQPQTQSA